MSTVSSNQRIIDAWGRVTLPSEAAIELLYQDRDISGMRFEMDDAIREYQEWCSKFRQPYKLDDAPTNTPEEEHARRAAQWKIAPELVDLDVREFLLSMCEREDERDRVNLEMDLYEERNLVPMLRMLFMLVDHFRQNDIVWGVGRGSSVASYCLYLIGIHKIDSIFYELDITEFLK